MKSLKYIVALALVAGLFQACDLERYPLTDLSEETFWNSESIINSIAQFWSNFLPFRYRYTVF